MAAIATVTATITTTTTIISDDEDDSQQQQQQQEMVITTTPTTTDATTDDTIITNENCLTIPTNHQRQDDNDNDSSIVDENDETTRDNEDDDGEVNSNIRVANNSNHHHHHHHFRQNNIPEKLTEAQLDRLNNLIKIIRQGSYNEFTELLSERTFKNLLNVFVDGHTALHYSLIYGRNLAWCKQLVSNGANPNLANRSGWHPVHLAAFNNSRETMRYLIDCITPI